MSTRLPYEYPGWVPPAPDSSQPGRTPINNSARDTREESIAAAMASPLPIAYGRNILKPLIFAAQVYNSYLYLGCAWCLGEIEEIVQIYDGDEPITSVWVKNNYTGVATQLPDPFLVTAIPDYNDTLVTTIRGETVSVAYSVLVIPVTADFPDLSAEVLGKRSWRHSTIDLFENALPRVPDTTAVWYKNEEDPVAIPEAIDGNDATYPPDFMQILYLFPSDNNQDLVVSPDVIVVEALLPQTVQAEQQVVLNYRDARPNRLYQFSPILESADALVEYRDATDAWQTLVQTTIGRPVKYGQEITTSTVYQFWNITFPIATPIDVTGIRLTLSNTTWSNWYGQEYVSVNGADPIWRDVKRWPYISPSEFELYAFFSVQFQYSNNAALCLADLIEDKAYGLGIPVNQPALKELVEWCEEQMPDGSLRHQLDLALTQRNRIEQYIETLRMYAECYVVKEGDEVFLIPDRPSPVADVLTEDDMVEGTFTLQQQSQRDKPNVVAVSYTDPVDTPNWKTPQNTQYHPDLATGLVEYRRNDLRLEGLHDERPARRAAIKRLNYFTLVNLYVECVVMDKAVRWRLGDVIQVNHQWGLENKPMRLVGINAISAGRYRCSFEEYDPKIYSDTIETVPSYPDTALAAPSNVPTVEILSASVDAEGVVFVEWTPATLYPYPHEFELQVGPSVVVTETTTGQVSGLSSGTYDVTVLVRGTWQSVVYTGQPTAAVQVTI